MQSFIESKKFSGRMDGYVFKNGEQGIGYYLDRINPYLLPSKQGHVIFQGASQSASNNGEVERSGQEKRKTPIDSQIDQRNKIARPSQAEAGDHLANQDHEEENAGHNGEKSNVIEQLDAISLKRLLLSFEKKITKNQQMRMKYPDDPEKFMESEFDLHKEIEELHVIAASPEFYPILVSMNTINSLLGMLVHENTDISIACLSLLQELTEVDTVIITKDEGEDEEANDEDDNEEDTVINVKATKQALQLITALLAREKNFLLILVQNLSRLTTTTTTTAGKKDKDDENIGDDEDNAKGIHYTLNILENLIDIQQQTQHLTLTTTASSLSSSNNSNSSSIIVAEDICSKTPFLHYLLTQQLHRKTFDENKLYSSEILSILLQSSRKNQLLFGHLPPVSSVASSTSSSSVTTVNGMDLLLQCIAIYRKRSSEEMLSDELECIENLFLALSSSLMVKVNQLLFLKSEGMELLMKCLSEQQYAAGCAITAISYAVMQSPSACRSLIDLGGLKYIFTIYTGKGGLKKAMKKKNSGEKRNIEENTISILAQLCSQLYVQPTSTTADAAAELSTYSQRIAYKFMENNLEKLIFTVGIFMKYYSLLKKTEQEISSTKARLSRKQEDREEYEEYIQPENLYRLRLDGGLFILQQVAVVLAFACMMDLTGCLPVVREQFHRQQQSTEGGGGGGISLMIEVIRGLILTLHDNIEEAEEDDSDEGKEEGDDELKEKVKQDRQYMEMLTLWSATLSKVLNQNT